MNMKTAIIIGVIILLISMVIAPFFISKNTDNEQNIVEGLSGDILKISGDILKISGDISGDNEIIDDNIEVITVTNQNISGEIIIDNDIKENFENISNESNLEIENNTEMSNSITNENTEITIKQEQNVEVQAPVQEEIETIINDVVIPSESIGVLKIDKIGLYQPVMEGHSLEVLRTHLGHVDGSAYWRGNIGILGHNNGNAGFFKRLTELKVDDIVEYITEEGTRTYKVSEIVEIEDTDWSKLSKTEDNRITLITCVRNLQNKRYCVQAVEI